MTETREFPIEVIASISTGILLCDFGKMHEAAEFLTGHPIWTHQFANKELNGDMEKMIAEQCPGMPTEMSGVTRDNYHLRVEQLRRDFGEKVTIRKGGGLTAMLPIDGIPDHLNDKTILVEK